MTPLRPLLVLCAIPLVAGCATASGDYPSLAQREAERVAGTFDPAPTAPTVVAPVAPSADLAARLAQLIGSAETFDRQFRAATPAAERASRSAGATGSDSWASAQVALAELDSLRSQAAVSLADLDALWVEATIDGAARDAVGSARDTVQSLVAEEDTVLARLRGRL